MDTSVIIIVIIVGVLLLLAFYTIGIYNKLINARNKVDNHFSQIDIQLKSMVDLIPNLVEIVKGYTKREKNVFKVVEEARNKLLSARFVNDKIEFGSKLTGALNKLFALSEEYSDLKANDDFLTLQNSLRNSEDKIRYAREFYNDSAKSFNNLVEEFPTNVVASFFRFKKYDFFKVSKEEEKKLSVKF